MHLAFIRVEIAFGGRSKMSRSLPGLQCHLANWSVQFFRFQLNISQHLLHCQGLRNLVLWDTQTPHIDVLHNTKAWLYRSREDFREISRSTRVKDRESGDAFERASCFLDSKFLTESRERRSSLGLWISLPCRFLHYLSVVSDSGEARWRQRGGPQCCSKALVEVLVGNEAET